MVCRDEEVPVQGEFKYTGVLQ